MTVERAGVILGLSRSAVYQAAQSGELPTVRVGRRILVPTVHLRRMLGLEDQPDGMARLAETIRQADLP